MGYSNESLPVHGPSCPIYSERPPISMNIALSDIERNGSTISCYVIASLNAVQLPSWFGYSMSVYAQLDDGPEQCIVSKGNTPDTWSSGSFGTGMQQLSSSNLSTSCTLNIYVEGNCTCNGGHANVYSITLSAPPSGKYKLSLATTTGVASFSGAGEYTAGTTASTRATASPGYSLSKYAGTNEWGTAQSEWYECAGKDSHNDTWNMNANRTITAYASPKQYKVSYDANGGSGTMSPSTAIYQSNFLTRANKFTNKAGTSFNGWNEKKDGTGTVWSLKSPGVYESGTPWKWNYTHDITLYAQWSTDAFTVSYNANGGSGAPSSQTKYKGASLVLTKSTPSTAKKITLTFNANGGTVTPTSSTKSCTFARWNTKANGSGTSYASGATYSKDENIVLYAMWSNATFSLPTPTLANSTFVGWYTAASGGTKVTNSTSFNASSTIYARWNYTIKYDANGGEISGGIPNSTKQGGVTLKLTSIVPSRDGKRFLGWSESKTATSATYAPGGNYTQDKATTLYAVWGPEIYTIKFDLNGGTYTGGGALEQKVEAGKSATLPNTPTRADREFITWSGDYKNVSHDATVYALWNGCPVWKYDKTNKKWKPYKPGE